MEEDKRRRQKWSQTPTSWDRVAYRLILKGNLSSGDIFYVTVEDFPQIRLINFFFFILLIFFFIFKKKKKKKKKENIFRAVIKQLEIDCFERIFLLYYKCT
jgi:hypothetical protein